MASPLRGAVIGIGNMGRNHLRIYADFPDVHTVAVADPDPAARAAAESRYGVRAYADYHELLRREQLDFLSITVPTALHYDVALATIAAGVPTLVEKPIAETSAQGIAIIEAAARHGVPVMVGHVERFNPAVVELKRRLQRGELGRVFQIHARRIGPLPERIKDVGVVIDLATHDLDIMSYLSESSVVRLHAEVGRKLHTNHEDILAALLRFENQIIGILDISWLSPAKHRELSIIGERGMFVVNYLTQELFLYENELTQQSGWQELAVLGVTEGRMIRFNIRKREPLREELRSFVDSVAQGMPPPISTYDALRALSLAEELARFGAADDAGEVEQGVWIPRPTLVGRL